MTADWQELAARVMGSICIAVTLLVFFWYPLQNLLAFVQPCKPGETWREFFRRVQKEFHQEQDRKVARWKQKRERDATMYGSRRKTCIVHWTNLGLLFGSLYLIAYVPGSLWWVVGYVAVGFIVNAWVGVVRFEGLPPLKRSER